MKTTTIFNTVFEIDPRKKYLFVFELAEGYQDESFEEDEESAEQEDEEGPTEAFIAALAELGVPPENVRTVITDGLNINSLIEVS